MPVITISRQFASAGQAVWRQLAERFGAELLDREIVAAVAERAGIPEAEAEGYDERLPGLWQRIATALAAGSPDPAIPPLPADMLPATAVHERLARLTRTVIEEAAERGNAVILGRGGAFIIGPAPGRHPRPAPRPARCPRPLPDDARRGDPARHAPRRGRRCASCAGPWTRGARSTSGACSGRTGSTPPTTTCRIDTSRVDHGTVADIIETVTRRRATLGTPSPR